jgi:mannose-6-phosphate isomerase-like protein (cupin superfamily)
MHIVPLEQAPRYEAPGHSGMQMRRLQGREAGPSDSVWLGLSVIEPGGGTTTAASGVEKFYVVIEGRLQVTACNGHEQVAVALLGPMDSCRIAPGESRRLHNPTSQACKVLLAMPNEPKETSK